MLALHGIAIPFEVGTGASDVTIGRVLTQQGCPLANFSESHSLETLATMPLYIIYCPVTLSLVPYALSCIGVDSDVPTKVSSTNDAESLVTILVEPSFISQVIKA